MKREIEIPKDISFPVKYDEYGQKIFDSENHLIADIRGWGRLKYKSNPEQRQDAIGKWIVSVMNASWGG